MEEENKLDELIGKYKIPMILGILGLVLLIGGLFSSGLIEKTFMKSTKIPAQASTGIQYSSTIMVDVAGEVISPGVYKLPLGSRVEDGIKAAGGVTEAADSEYLTKKLNLALKLTDGAKIYIPKVGENDVTGNVASSIAGTSSQTSLININSATAEELDKLPGVGSVTAQKIIDSRPYASIEELFTKKAVTKAVYDKIKSSVSVY